MFNIGITHIWLESSMHSFGVMLLSVLMQPDNYSEFWVTVIPVQFLVTHSSHVMGCYIYNPPSYGKHYHMITSYGKLWTLNRLIDTCTGQAITYFHILLLSRDQASPYFHYLNISLGRSISITYVTNSHHHAVLYLSACSILVKLHHLTWNLLVR